jgi:hypothetical protein
VREDGSSAGTARLIYNTARLEEIMSRRLAASLLVLVVAGGALTARARFASTWADSGSRQLTFLNQKVVTLVISEDESLRMSAEEGLAGELGKRGVQGVAAYRLIPREELRDPQRARGWFERAGAAGAISMRLVDLTREKIPSSVVWTGTPHYGSFWDYYPWGWSTTVAIVPGRNNTKVVVETLVYDLVGNRLVWAGTSETTNAKDARAIIHDIVDATADELKERGFTRQ